MDGLPGCLLRLTRLTRTSTVLRLVGYMPKYTEVKRRDARAEASRIPPLENPHEVPRKQRKRCTKCRKWYLINEDSSKSGFSIHKSAHDGFGVMCKACRTVYGRQRRDSDPRQRVKHHFSTRITAQLGDACPKHLTRNLEEHLGYRIRKLIAALTRDLRAREGPKRKLIDAFQEGYHIDHIRPVVSFNVITPEGEVDWETFRECWAMDNLRIITAEENLLKGASYDGD